MIEKQLFVVWVKENKKVQRYYFKAYFMETVLNYIDRLNTQVIFEANIIQIKRLKRIYRKTDNIREI